MAEHTEDERTEPTQEPRPDAKYAKQYHKFMRTFQRESHGGWASAAFGLGSVAGGLLMSTWGGFRRRFVTMAGGFLVFGLVNLVRGLAPANAFWLYLCATLKTWM